MIDTTEEISIYKNAGMDDPPIPPTDTPRFSWRPACEAFLPRSPREMVVEGLIAASTLSFLVGDGGSKKSITALDMAVCVAMGANWLQFPTTQGAVLWIDEDNGEQTTLERFERAMIGHGVIDIPMSFVSGSGFDAGSLDDINALHAKIVQDNVKLVIIDAWIDIIGGRDENKSNEMQPLLANLRRVAESTKTAILIIHHTNRGKEYRGSTAIKGKLDLMLQVESKPDSPNIDFTIEKIRNGAAFGFAASVNFEQDRTYMLESVKSVDKSIPKAQEYVLRYLWEYASATTEAIENNAEPTCKPRTASNQLGKLKEMGFIMRTDAGGAGGRGKVATYSLTEKGREYVDKHL